MRVMKFAKGARHHLGQKMIIQAKLSHAEADLYLSEILDEVADDSNILYDFEAIEYCKKRIASIRKESCSNVD